MMQRLKSIYDIEKTYLENSEEGPFFSGEYPKLEIPQASYDFLGFEVSSKIGIFAGPLLNSRWIEFASNMGFDILTYKTIRSKEFEGHPLPNIVYVDHPPFDPCRLPQKVVMAKEEPPTHRLGITNSFGMPSRSPTYLEKDIPKANRSLKKGQVMIVSVTGTPGGNYIQDFVETALLAKSAGAKIIEANFSCPNVTKEEGSLYLDPQSAFDVASEIVSKIEDTPLIVKVGHFHDKNIMTKTLIALAAAGVKAVAGINSLSLNVLNERGDAALGKERLKSGLCGAPIRECALEFVRDAKSILIKENLKLTLVGGGGIMEASHFRDFFHAGADFAFVATGMMWNPYLAYEASLQHKETIYAHV